MGTPAERSHIHFPCDETFRTKSGREERVYIPTPARVSIEAIRTEGTLLWGYYKDTFSHYFTALLRDAGIESGSLHTLRHTCASWMAQQGVSGAIIQEHLRHSSYKVTQRYMHLSPSDTSAHVERAFETS